MCSLPIVITIAFLITVSPPDALLCLLYLYFCKINYILSTILSNNILLMIILLYAELTVADFYDELTVANLKQQQMFDKMTPSQQTVDFLNRWRSCTSCTRLFVSARNKVNKTNLSFSKSKSLVKSSCISINICSWNKSPVSCVAVKADFNKLAVSVIFQHLKSNK